MKYRSFGSTGEQISQIVLGGWLFGVNSWGDVKDSDSVATIHAAIDLGVTMVDTAEGYGGGHSEEVIGEALHDRRDKMMIATKVSPSRLHHDDIFAACDESLKRLRTDVIDLYQVHWPNADVPIEETFAALKELQDAGKIRWIGVSNFSSAQIDEASKIVRIESLQPPYNLFWRHIEADQLPYCARNDIAVIPYSPLAQGMLTGKFTRDAVFESDDIRNVNQLFQDKTYGVAMDGVDQMRSMAVELGCGVIDLAVAWILAQPGITAPITGARNPAQVEGLVTAVELELSEEHAAQLSRIGDAVMTTLDDSPVMWR
jgi:myo-inositol catabolism protein IolS